MFKQLYCIHVSWFIVIKPYDQKRKTEKFCSKSTVHKNYVNFNFVFISLKFLTTEEVPL